MALILAQQIFIRHAARPHRFFNGGIHRMELVITRDDLVQTVAVRVFFKHNEMLEQVEETFRFKYPAHQHIQLQRRLRRIVPAVYRAPHLEPFLISRQRSDARICAIGHHQHLVVVEQAANLLLIGLQLIERRPDGRILIRRIFQLDHRQRQAVDEHNDVGPPIILAFDNGELVHRQPVIVLGVIKIHQPRMIARNAAICAPVFHRNPIAQHGVKVPVGLC